MFEEQIAVLASSAFASGEALFGRFGATVALLSVGIAVYAAIVGTFYTFLSRRVLYETKPENRKGISGLIHRFGGAVAVVLKYTFLFPAITFVWFAFISTFLFLLSRTVALETVFVLSISLVAAVRALAYYKQEIAVDLAKLLPLVMLGVLIVDPTLFSRELVESRVLQLAGALPEFAAFVVFVVVLEWFLRVSYFFVTLVKGTPAVETAVEESKQAGK